MDMIWMCVRRSIDTCTCAIDRRTGAPPLPPAGPGTKKAHGAPSVDVCAVYVIDYVYMYITCMGIERPTVTRTRQHPNLFLAQLRDHDTTLHSIPSPQHSTSYLRVIKHQRRALRRLHAKIRPRLGQVFFPHEEGEERPALVRFGGRGEGLKLFGGCVWVGVGV